MADILRSSGNVLRYNGYVLRAGVVANWVVSSTGATRSTNGPVTYFAVTWSFSCTYTSGTTVTWSCAFHTSAPLYLSSAGSVGGTEVFSVPATVKSVSGTITSSGFTVGPSRSQSWSYNY